MPRLLLSLALFLLVAPPAQSEDSGGESDLNTSLRVQLSWSVEGAQVHSVRWDRRPPEQRSGAVEDPRLRIAEYPDEQGRWTGRPVLTSQSASVHYLRPEVLQSGLQLRHRSTGLLELSVPAPLEDHER